MRRKWSLHRRGSIFYAQIRNKQTGRFMTARSTGKETEDEAVLVIAEWLRAGMPTGRRRKRRVAAEVFTLDAILEGIRKAIITPEDAGRIIAALKDRGLVEIAVVKVGPGAELLEDFLVRFWTYEESPYVREKLAHGQTIGKRHCYESMNRVRRYWIPHFKGKRLAEIRKADLKEFSLTLSEKNLSPASVNKILIVGTTAFRWAKENDLIPTDPTEGLTRFSGTPTKRGILTEKEAENLFRKKWKDERGRIGNLLAMTTGLRAGEVLGLQFQDIGEDRLYIRHAWGNKDGWKTPKNGEARTVPLIPSIRKELLSLASSNPWGSAATDFVFYSSIREQPMDNHFLIDGLYSALKRIKISAKTRRERNVSFHSWRHFFSARMADRLNARQVMLATGHKDEEVFNGYASHGSEENFQVVAGTAAEVFGTIIPFKKAL